MSVKTIYVEEDQQTSDDGDIDQKVVINTLDYDSLAKIIMLLPIPERIDMEKVCTKWKEACQLAWYDIKEYKCETSIGRCYDNRLLTQSYLEEILSRCGNYLIELSLSDVCNSSIMSFVGDHCKNLTSLQCEFPVDSLEFDADHFVQAFTQLDKLKCIKITVNHRPCYSKAINFSAVIKSLTKKINEIHLFSKSVVFKKRRVLMSLKKFKNLKKFTLHGLWSDTILHEISEITTLVHLDIRLYDIPEGLSLFNKLVNLEYIDLTMMITTSSSIDNKLSTKELETIFCTCKNLKHLDIPFGPYDVAKIPLAKWINFKNLEYLGITCNMMPDLANTIVEYCKNLKHLRIHYAYHIINNTAFIKLTELKNLESLILNSDTVSVIYKLQEESITAISNNCKKLKRLEIHGCTIVPSIHGEPLSSPSVLNELSKLKYLEHLNLSETLHIKDSTIIAVANNCKNLKSLNIRRCTHITETGLIALTNLKNLQKLGVSFLDTITDSFLIKLKGLKELNCFSCSNLTDVGIIQFIKNNPDLEFLDVCSIYKITIKMVTAANEATKNRTNGIILYIRIFDHLIRQLSKAIIESQWLVVGFTC